LGQEDFFGAGFEHANQLRPNGSGPGVGLSTHRPEEATRALRAKPDYIAIGPIYSTATKPTAQPVTLEYVRWAAHHVTSPWFAIGGINLRNIEAVIAAGARRVCVVSDILNAPDIVARCREYKSRLIRV
jgi:thiamine-phosphate pyrophosphorylase